MHLTGYYEPVAEESDEEDFEDEEDEDEEMEEEDEDDFKAIAAKKSPADNAAAAK